MFQPRITQGFLDDNLRSNYLQLESVDFATHIEDFEGLNSIPSNQLRGLLRLLKDEKRIFTQDRVLIETPIELEESHKYQLISTGVNGNRTTLVYREHGPLLFSYKPEIRAFETDITLE